MSEKNISRKSFMEGIKAISPILAGVFPFGAIVGVTVVSVGIDPFQAIAMSFIIFAGASQLATADLVAKNAPFFVIALTALVVNMRFFMYSASIAPYFRNLKRRWKILLSYILTDQGYAVSITRFQSNPEMKGKRWFYLGAGVALFITWHTGNILGVFLGLQVPESWSLDFAVPLTFLAILIPAIKDIPSVAAAVVSGVVSVAGFNLPLHTGIIAASLCGIFTGFFVETIKKRGTDDSQ